MAGIDKIYGTYDQLIELKEWLGANETEIECVTGWDGDDIVESVLPSNYIYGGREFEGAIAISNFPPEIDNWLWNNCPIKFVTDRINIQYEHIA